MKKSFCVGILCILSGICICSCANRNQSNAAKESKNVTVNSKSISDYLYNEIYLEEKNGYAPYIVVSNDYDGKTLLLRKYLLSEDMKMNNYDAYYEDCEMDTYLNTIFYNSLSEKTKSFVEDTTIQIVNKDYYVTNKSVVEIQRKIFLLSFTELGYDNNNHVGLEGRKLKYFKLDNYNNRIATAYDGGIAYSWWLRSADTTYESCFYAVGAEGEIGSTNAFSVNGIRPAFCVKSDLKISTSSYIVNDKTVYIIVE